MPIIEDEEMKIKIEGVSRFAQKIRLLDQTVRKEVKIGLMQGGFIVQDKATEILKTVQWQTRSKSGYWRQEGAGKKNRKWYPPGSTIVGHWVTGNLARSLHTRLEENSQDDIDVVIGSDSPYAPDVESLPDGGFLTPALIQSGDIALKHVVDQVSKAIKGTGTGG